MSSTNLDPFVSAPASNGSVPRKEIQQKPQTTFPFPFWYKRFYFCNKIVTKYMGSDTSKCCPLPVIPFYVMCNLLQPLRQVQMALFSSGSSCAMSFMHECQNIVRQLSGKGLTTRHLYIQLNPFVSKLTSCICMCIGQYSFQLQNRSTGMYRC